jgi:hypothetical protein
MEEETEKGKNKLYKFFFGWIKDNYDKAFIAILIFAIIIRLYFLIITKDQAVWWDTADYLSYFKKLAGVIKFDYLFTPRRTFLLPLIWLSLFKLGFGEFSFHVLEFLFSIFSVIGMYFMGKEIFNKKIALISSFLMSIFWMNLFYSTRIMTEIPTLTFLIFSTFFFWKGYTKKDEKAFIWFGLFLGLAFLARAGTLVMFAVFPIFLLITERFRFFKRKYLWIGVFVTILLMAAFFIYTSYAYQINSLKYFLALTPDTLCHLDYGCENIPIPTRFEDITGISGIFDYFALMPHYFGIVLLSLFLFGLGTFFLALFIRFDLLLKRKSYKFDKYLFILLFALIPFIFQSMFYHGIEDRYLMNAFPAFFIILSFGIIKMGKLIRKYNKQLAIVFIILILSLGAYQQLNYANNLIKSKIPSYLEVKQSGEWIKENSLPTDVIFSASIPQHTYYSERKTYNFMDKYTNESSFEYYVDLYKPKYLVLSIYEPHSQWAYEYPSYHKDLLIPVKVYQQNEQLILAIYEFNYS